MRCEGVLQSESRTTPQGEAHRPATARKIQNLPIRVASEQRCGPADTPLGFNHIFSRPRVATRGSGPGLFGGTPSG